MNYRLWLLLEDRLRLLSVLGVGVGGRPPASPGAGGSAPSRYAVLCPCAFRGRGALHAPFSPDRLFCRATSCTDVTSCSEHR